MSTEQQIYEKLLEHMETEGILPILCHSSNGDRILRVINDPLNLESLYANLSLMVMVEVYDNEDGSHKTVPLGDLAQTIAEWPGPISGADGNSK